MKFRTMGTALAIAGLITAPALAQTSSTNSSVGHTGNTMATTANPAAPGTAAPLNSRDNTTASSSTGSSLMGDRVQEIHGAYLSSKLVGATVYNDHKDNIGSIDNLLVDQSGKITQAVISVGGFLGVGSKLVEVPFSSLQFQQDGSGSGREIMLPHATQQSLKSMQEFSYNG